MSAPAPGTRTTPNGIMLENGYQSLLTIENDPDINLWETAVTPPGADGGDSIDVTTMHNTVYRTKAPAALIDITDGQITCAYHAAVLTQILAQINVEQTLTYTLPDGTTIAIYGYVKSFTPTGLTNGELPTATVDLVHTNRDPTSGAEEAAVIAPGSGT